MAKTKAPKSIPPAAVPEHDASAEHVHGPNCDHDHGHGEFFEIELRPYEPKDYRQLRALWVQSEMRLDDTDSKAYIEKCLKTRKNSFNLFVAEAQMMDESKKNKKVGKAKIVGGTICTFDGRRNFVYHMVVDEKFRGMGIGGALLQTCEAQAKKWGGKHLRLLAYSDASRGSAHDLYERAGWTVDKRLWLYRKIV